MASRASLFVLAASMLVGPACRGSKPKESPPQAAPPAPPRVKHKGTAPVEPPAPVPASMMRWRDPQGELVRSIDVNGAVRAADGGVIGHLNLESGALELQVGPDHDVAVARFRSDAELTDLVGGQRSVALRREGDRYFPRHGGACAVAPDGTISCTSGPMADDTLVAARVIGRVDGYGPSAAQRQQLMVLLFADGFARAPAPKPPR